MEETFDGTPKRVPSVIQRLRSLHRVLHINEGGSHDTSFASLRLHLCLLPNEDKIFDDLLAIQWR